MKGKILYIGTFNNKKDEGLSQTSLQFKNYFTSRYNLLTINTRYILKFSVLKSIIQFKPDIIHYLTGPTIRSFVICGMMKILLRTKVILIISATRPFLKHPGKDLLFLLKPDLILTQALKWEIFFNQKGIQTEFIPNQVSLSKFKNLNIDKEALRLKYNLPIDKKLLLHVGHIKKNRNLDFFINSAKTLNQSGYKIIIIGSTAFDEDEKLRRELEKSGCIVTLDYIEKIEEIYNACDFYVFPITNLSFESIPKRYNEVGVIDMPLSILEALACGLAVISTEIDSIDRLVKNEKKIPIQFFDGTTHSLLNEIKELENIAEYDFSLITRQIDESYILNKVDNIYRRFFELQ